MGEIISLFTNLSSWGTKLFYIFLPIFTLTLGLILFYRFLNACGRTYRVWINHQVEKKPDDTKLKESAKAKKAKTDVMVWILTILSTIIIMDQVVQLLGINLAGVIPAATVIGAGVGFGSQYLFKDIIQGMLIVSEKQYGVGDIITITTPGSEVGVSGEVEQLTLRSTKLRTVSGDLVTLSNRNVEQVINLSTGFSVAIIDIPVPPPPVADTNTALDIVGDTAQACAQEKTMATMIIGKPEVMGVEKVTATHLDLRVKVTTLPSCQWDVARYFKQHILDALSAQGISIKDIPTPLPDKEG